MVDIESIKRDIKAELKPRKVLRYAFVPHFGGLLTPIKDVFSIFVKTIGLLFVQAKLISPMHPAVTGEIHGFSAIWQMILDAASNLKFKKENLNQIVVFYAVVGMIIFSVLATVTFLLHISMGKAHAQNVVNTAALNGLFTDPTACGTGNCNANTWLNTLFPYAATGGGAGVVGALGKMLATYNTGILVLAIVLGLWSVISMVLDSAHHGTVGGQRHSELYAPIRLVFGIGLLIPVSNGYNTSQILAITMAHMGSGLASNVWTSFESTLSGLAHAPIPSPEGTLNPILQTLIIDETCAAAIQYANSSKPGTGLFSSATPLALPASANVTMTQTIGYSGTGAALLPNSYKYTFDRTPGDAYCGSITIPAQIPNLTSISLKCNDYVARAYTSEITDCGGAGITTPIIDEIYTKIVGPIILSTTGSTSGTYYNPAANPLSPAASPGEPWKTLSANAYKDITTVGTAVFTDYSKQITANLNPINPGNDVSGDWTTAGFVFLQWSHLATDLYNVQNPEVSVTLPQDEILPGSVRDSSMSTCGAGGWWAWLSGKVTGGPYVCTDQGKFVFAAVNMAIMDAQAGQTQAGIIPAALNPGSIAGSNNDGVLGRYLADFVTSLSNGLQSFTTASGVGAAAPSLGQSIWNCMYLGQLLLGMSGVMYVLAIGVGFFSNVGGLIMVTFATAMFPLGVSLAIMLPLLPASRFFFGILTWLLSLFEALICLPIVALWHLNSEGEGLFAHGKQGYLMVIQMMLRPTLMIFGLIGSILIFDTLAGFLNQTLWGVYTGMAGGQGKVTQFITLLGFMFVYCTLIYGAGNACFNLINLIPDTVLAWIGSPLGMSASRNDGTDTAAGTAQNAAATAGYQIGQGVTASGTRSLREHDQADKAIGYAGNQLSVAEDKAGRAVEAREDAEATAAVHQLHAQAWSDNYDHDVDTAGANSDQAAKSLSGKSDAHAEAYVSGEAAIKAGDDASSAATEREQKQQGLYQAKQAKKNIQGF